jgi:hypothetical protein
MAVEKYLLMHYTLHCLIGTARHTNGTRKILNISAVWDVMSYDLVEILMFQKNVLPQSRLKLSTLKMEIECSFRISVNISQPVKVPHPRRL